MAKKQKQQAAAAPAPAPHQPELRPPAWFAALRWFCFVASVALAIGALALLDKRLTSVPWTIPDAPPPGGTPSKYAGRDVRLSFCLLSPSDGASVDARCNAGFAAAAVAIGLALLWSYVQALRANPFRNPSARACDLALCVLGCAWWAAAAVLASIIADQANRAGLPEKDARNGLAVIFWAGFLMWAGLMGTSALMLSQRVFDKFVLQQQRRRAEKLAAREHQAAQAEAAAAAAAVHAAGVPASSGGGGGGPGAGAGAAAAAGTAAAPAGAAIASNV